MILSKRLFILPSNPPRIPALKLIRRSNGLFHAHDHRQLGMETSERDAVKLL